MSVNTDGTPSVLDVILTHNSLDIGSTSCGAPLGKSDHTSVKSEYCTWPARKYRGNQRGTQKPIGGKREEN